MAQITALQVTEAVAISQTEAEWGVGIAKLHDAAGTLLHLGEKSTGLQEPDCAGSWFEFYTRSAYAQIGYSIKGVLTLLQRAYYMESLILVRHLLEVVVQLRFFNESPESLRPHLEDKHRISLRRMFERFAPGFYDETYGLVLSGVAHGKHGAMLFRLDRKSAEIRSGCFYDGRSAALVIYYLLSLVAALFTFYRSFVRAEIAEEVWADIDDYHAWFRRSLRDQIQLNPESESWYAEVFQLLGLEPLGKTSNPIAPADA